MQGPMNSLSSLSENRSFDHESSSDSGMDSQMPWNNTQAETTVQYLHHVGNEGINAEWSLGEASSGSAQTHQGEQHERRRETRSWTNSQASLNLEGPSHLIPLNNANANANQFPKELRIMGSNILRQDLNMPSGSGSHEDDDCQVVERPNTFNISIGAPNEHVPSNREDTPGSSKDGRRMACKRKAIEGNVGQSSGSGSSNSFTRSERSQWHAVPGLPAEIANNNILQTENGLVEAKQEPSFRVGASPFTFTARIPSEHSRRNLRLRINGAHQQDPTPGVNPFLAEPDLGGSNVSSRHSSSLIHNSLFDLNPTPPVENGSPNGQSMPLNAPSVRRNHQSRWHGASSSRANNSSSPAALYEEPLPRYIPRRISEHSMFFPATEIGSSSQQNYNMVGESNNVAGNIASSSRAGPNSGPNSSSPSWATRACPQYPRRLSELVRRSLLSSAGNHGVGSSSSHEGAPPSSSSGVNGHTRLTSRAALLERHLDGAIPVPVSLRTSVTAGEGRSNIMSEQIRHVLDLIRRGEGLRYEDVMMLDHSVLFGMADRHDRHRDMRLDVDNMSYEELLALGDRIGSVCTGLTEETIMSRLKLQKYVGVKVEQNVETEPCSICREEFNDGEDVGKLDCGHDFHKECIKQWLLLKNLCPICKTTGLNP